MTKTKRPPQKYPLVEVLWDDASSLKHGWLGGELGEPEAQVVMSVGYLVKDHPKYLIIAMDLDPDGLHNTRGQIPRGMLRSMKVLRKKDTDKTKTVNEPIQMLPSD